MQQTYRHVHEERIEAPGEQAAADELTEEFQFNIPLRWTIAHLYQRMLDGEEVEALLTLCGLDQTGR